MFFGFGRGAGQPGRQYTRVVTTPTKKRPAKRVSRLCIAFTQAAFSRSMPGIYSGTDEELAVFGHGCSDRSASGVSGRGRSGRDGGVREVGRGRAAEADAVRDRNLRGENERDKSGN